MSEATDSQDGTQQYQGDSAGPEIMPMNFSAIENLPETIKAPMPQIRSGEKRPLSSLYNVPFTLVFEVGRIDISIGELMGLKKGVVMNLKHVSVDSIDIRVSGMTLGYGEIIALQTTYGIRFRELDLISQLDNSEISKQTQRP